MIVLWLAEAVLVAWVMRILSQKFNFPTVTAYVIGGVILGGTIFFWPRFLGDFAGRWLFSDVALRQLEFFTQIAIAAISLTIGTELEWLKLRALSRSIISIALCEALGAFLIVSVTVYLISRNPVLSIVLGSISSATAPAATFAIIQQFRARGPLTNTVLAVVGMDDAISFILFSFALSLAKGVYGGVDYALTGGILMPFVYVTAALMIGVLIGFAGGKFLVISKDPDTFFFLLASVILWVSVIANLLNVSELLANMAAGATIINMYPLLRKRIRSALSPFLTIFYAVFFIIGGAYLDLRVIGSVWVLAIIDFIARSAGKVYGASLGARIGKSSPSVTRWIGPTLIPQVGAAIALAILIQKDFGTGDYGIEGIALADITMNVVLVTTLITESVGPYLAKVSLFKSGEAQIE